MTQPNLLELAKRGHPKAIETLLNRSLKNVYITAQASIKDECLYLVLESDRDVRNLNQQKIVSFVNKKITDIQSEIIKSVKVYGRKIGEDLPAWIQEFKLGEMTNPETLQAIEKEQQHNYTETIDKDNANIEETSENQVKDQLLQLPDELNHFFIGYNVASEGGTQKVTLRSGKSYEVKIPSNSTEGDKLGLEGYGLQGNKVIIVLHTLFDKSLELDKLVHLQITNTDIKPESKRRCREAYKVIRNAQYTQDIAALDLLDFLVSTRIVDPLFCQRYTTASQNSRLTGIEECIEDALTASSLHKIDKQSIRATYQCIRVGEHIPKFDVLNQLDSIIQNSGLPEELKQVYFRSSVTSRAITTELFIVNLINTYPCLTSGRRTRSEVLTAYTELRDGEQVSDQTALKLLDSIVFNADIPDDCKVMYKLMREPVTKQNGKAAGDEATMDAVKKVYDSVKKASGFVPAATKVATTMGAKAGTGAVFGTFCGGAATNATLAWLGGGSVASGGLGMLGGLTVATGGAALIGAAALLSVVSVSQMDVEDKKNLGIAAGAGVATSAAAVWTAWAAVSTFGVASTGTAIGTLSGAAAYSATMAALGGVGVMTGGAALIAVGAGFAAWKLFKGDKNDPKRILKNLEARLYL